MNNIRVNKDIYKYIVKSLYRKKGKLPNDAIFYYDNYKKAYEFYQELVDTNADHHVFILEEKGKILFKHDSRKTHSKSSNRLS